MQQYLQTMADDEQLSASYCNQARAMLKVLYERMLHQLEKVRYLPRMHEGTKAATGRVQSGGGCPPVTGNTESEAPGALDNGLLHWVACWRGVRLRVSDIDSDRKVIWMTVGKGKKDRYTLLSEAALAVLREYYGPTARSFWGMGGWRRCSGTRM